MKQDIQRRRQARIRELIAGQAESDRSKESYRYPEQERNRPFKREKVDFNVQTSESDDKELDLTEDSNTYKFSLLAVDRDPEIEWKESRRQWSDPYSWSDKPVREENGRRPTFNVLRIQVAVAILLFGGVFLLLQFPQPWTQQANQWVQQSLQKNTNLTALTSWYEATFGGSPAFIPIWSQPDQEAKLVQANYRMQSPLDGVLLQPFTADLQGVQLIPHKEGADVLSAAVGRVIDVVRDDLNLLTITLQHAEGYVTIYGQLATTEVATNDWLEAGEVIGTMPVRDVANKTETAMMYFAVQQNGRYVNPQDVIDLD